MSESRRMRRSWFELVIVAFILVIALMAVGVGARLVWGVQTPATAVAPTPRVEMVSSDIVGDRELRVYIVRDTTTGCEVLVTTYGHTLLPCTPKTGGQ